MTRLSDYVIESMERDGDRVVAKINTGGETRAVLTLAAGRGWTLRSIFSGGADIIAEPDKNEPKPQVQAALFKDARERGLVESVERVTWKDEGIYGPATTAATIAHAPACDFARHPDDGSSRCSCRDTMRPFGAPMPDGFRDLGWMTRLQARSIANALGARFREV